MIRAINFLSVLAFIVSAGTAILLFYALELMQQRHETDLGTVQKDIKEIHGRLDAGDLTVAGLDAIMKATVTRQEGITKTLASLGDEVTTTSENIKTLEAELRKVAAKAAAATAAVKKELQDVSDKAAAEMTKHKQLALTAATQAKLDWVGKFAAIEQDYPLLICYSKEMVAIFPLSLIYPKVRVTDGQLDIIINAFTKIADTDIQALADGGLKDFNTALQKDYDSVNSALTAVYGALAEKKKKLAAAIQSCGALNVIGKT